MKILKLYQMLDAAKCLVLKEEMKEETQQTQREETQQTQREEISERENSQEDQDVPHKRLRKPDRDH